ncbi:MAG: ABC transporter, partial [Actinomycetaceae bacterium]|nr:ABC transporter [Actinomycetaceae bacterium]
MNDMSLNEAVGGLHSAIELGGSYLDRDVVERAREVVQRSHHRRAAEENVTVVALAGATGTGKSSLLNALVGQDVARVAATRPTTAVAQAIYNRPCPMTLDWLGISARHHMPDLDQRLGLTGGLVLVDLPDIDSTEIDNRVIAERLSAMVDVVVWVLDPQKYADAVVHEDYFARLGEHADVTVTVLNQADRLSETQLAGVLEHLAELLDGAGIHTQTLATSATTGRGVDQLRAIIAQKVTQRNAMLDKLAADVRTSARELAGSAQYYGGKDPNRANQPSFETVARQLALAGGASVVARAAGESYSHRARKATGWPLTRWIQRAKVDPLKRLRLADAREEPRKGQSAELVPDGSGVTTVTGVVVNESALTQARVAVRNYAEESTAHMPRAWAREVRQETARHADDVVKNLDVVITRTPVEADRVPFWWRLVGFLQWVFFGVALVGAGWIAALALADPLTLKLPEPAYYGIFSLPLIMLIGGVGAGWVLAILARFAANRGAVRTQERVG